MSVVLSPQVCGNLSQQQQETRVYCELVMSLFSQGMYF